MLGRLLRTIRRRAEAGLRATRRRLAAWTRPDTSPSLVLGAVADLMRSRSDLIAENALLRQQLIVLARTQQRPRLTRSDRALLVLLAGRVRAWRQALLVVRPETLLRWHRAGFQLFWRWKSAPRRRQRRIQPATIALIRRMATENRLWGAERIRGELRKLGIAVCKRTVQKYMRQARPPRPPGQTWATFLRTHAWDIWACDFLRLTDPFFRPLFAFFVVELAARRVVHVDVTRSPTDTWIAQQLRVATPEGNGLRFLVRDNDDKFGPAFARVAATSGIYVLRTPPRAPRANAVCEWFLGSARRECLDHVMILGEQHLRRVLVEYVRYFNHGRPHQGLGQGVPARPDPVGASRRTDGPIVAIPILGGPTTSTVESPDEPQARAEAIDGWAK
jgi:putative transposase